MIPTSSQLNRYEACRGAWNVERDIPPSPTTPDAASGTTIHAALDTGDTRSLDVDEQQTYQRCQEILMRCFPYEMLSKERRFFLVNPTGKTVLSGKADLIQLDEDSIHIIEFKTGRNAVPPPMENWQMLSLAVMAWEEYRPAWVHLAIIQPWVSFEPVTAVLTSHDVSQIKQQLFTLLSDIETSTQRTPSLDACRYCRAKATCPKAWGIVKSLETLPPAQWAVNLNTCELAQDIIDAVRAGAKTLMLAGAKVPGYEIVYEQRTTYRGGDLQMILNRGAFYGLNIGNFLPCCKLVAGDLRKTIAQSAYLKGAELTRAIATITDDLGETKTISKMQRA
jgi:hypothetical protein